MKTKLSGVAETLLIPLWARAEETKRTDGLIRDDFAVRLVEQIDYDFAKFARAKHSQAGVAVRSCILDHETKAFIEKHPEAVCINLACGLDTRFYRIDNGQIDWYNLDLPDVIELRRRLLEDGERHRTIPASALDFAWPDHLEDVSRDVLVIIEGLSMYLEQEEVRTLLDIIAARLPGATVLIEVMSRLFQRYGRERSVEDAGARYTYGCSSAAEFRRTVAPGYTLLHDVPFTRTIARYHPLLAPLTRLPLVGRLSERIVVLRAPA